MTDNTNRNRRVMALIDAGQTYSEVADAMNISRSAVAGIVYRNRTDRQEGAAA